METAWYWRQGGHTERWNVCEVTQRALYSAGPNTHMNTCPGPSGSRNSPAYHLSHDPLGDFVFLTPRTLRSLGSPILPKRSSPARIRREQQERGTPYRSRSNWSWPAEGSMVALTQEEWIPPGTPCSPPPSSALWTGTYTNITPEKRMVTKGLDSQNELPGHTYR